MIWVSSAAGELCASSPLAPVAVNSLTAIVPPDVCAGSRRETPGSWVHSDQEAIRCDARYDRRESLFAEFVPHPPPRAVGFLHAPIIQPGSAPPRWCWR